MKRFYSSSNILTTTTPSNNQVITTGSSSSSKNIFNSSFNSALTLTQSAQQFSTSSTTASSTVISLNDTEDYTFLCYLKEIEIRYTILPKSCRVRIERWIEKLIQVDTNPILIKERNLYARLLLEMLFARSLSFPFTHLPNDGPLPAFPSHLKARMKNFVGAHESLFWRDLYERLIPRQVDPSFPELEATLEECKELINELWEKNQHLEQVKQELVSNLEGERKLTLKLSKKLEKYNEMEVEVENSQQVIEDLRDQIRGLEKLLKQTQQTIVLTENENSTNSSPSLSWLHNSHAQFLEYQKIYEKFHLKVIHALKFTECNSLSSDNGTGGSGSGGSGSGGHSILQAKEKLNDLLIKQRDDYIGELLSHLENYNSNQTIMIEKVRSEWEKKFNELSDRYETLQKDYSEVDRRKSDNGTKCESLERIKVDLEYELDQFKKSNENLVRKLSYYQDMESKYEDSDQIIVDLKEQIKILEKSAQRSQQMAMFQLNPSETERSLPSSTSAVSPSSDSASLSWLHNSHAQFLEYQKIYEKFHLKVIHALKFTECNSLSSDSGNGGSGGHSILQAKEKLNDLLIKQRDDYIGELLSHLENYNSNQTIMIEKIRSEWEKKFNELSDRYETLQKDYQLSEQKLTEGELSRQLVSSNQRNLEIQIERLQIKLHLYENYYEKLLNYISELEQQRLESSYTMETLVVNALNTLSQPLSLEETHHRHDRTPSRSVLEPFPTTETRSSLSHHSYLPHHIPQQPQHQHQQQSQSQSQPQSQSRPQPQSLPTTALPPHHSPIKYKSSL